MTPPPTHTPATASVRPAPRPSHRAPRPATLARFHGPLHRNFSDPSYRDIVMDKIAVYLTRTDAFRLEDFAAGTLLEPDAAAAIGKILRGAVRVAHPEEIPPHVVSLNSVVRAHDRRTGRVRTCQLVFPGDPGDGSTHRLVVLTGAGLALLGARVGDLVSWQTPCRRHSVQIEAISQPTRSGSRRPPQSLHSPQAICDELVTIAPAR